MLYVSKAALDTVLGANFARQDLSPVISLLTTRPRPVSQALPQIPATNQIHQWVEQGRNNPGSAAAATYAEGALPGTAAKAPTRPQNITCRVGETAQVTDEETAVWTGAGQWKLAQGEEERMLQEAIDLQTELVTLDVLDQIEWMHISGDSSNPQVMSGGQTDGLIKWITANGVVVTTGGTTSVPVNFTEDFVRDAARSIAENYPMFQPDTLLIGPELKADVNTFVGGGANRPIVQLVKDGADGTTGLTGGSDVMYYNTGYSVVKVEIEPNLSHAFNADLPQNAAILCNLGIAEKGKQGKTSGQVKHANLIKLGAEPLARTDTSIKKMVVNTFAQEHRCANGTAIIPNVKSAIA